MCGRVLLAGLLTTGAAAFGPAPIRWGGAPQQLVLAPTHTGVSIAGSQPLRLMIADSVDEIPRFVVKPDHTISLDGKGLCIDASRGSEFTVRLNACLGGPTQRWNWLPWGPIQLEGTNQCLDVTQRGGDFRSAPVELRECENKASESWKFEWRYEDPSPTPESLTSMRHVNLYFTSLLGVLGLGALAWLWRWKSSAASMNQSSEPFGVEQGGVSLIEHWNGSQPLREVTPAVMAKGEALESVNLESSNVPAVMVTSVKTNDTGAFCYGLPGVTAPMGEFDPAGFSRDASKLDVYRLREAELTHGRVGMLAAAGFLTQEKFHPLFDGVGGPAINQIPQLPPALWFLMTLGIGVCEAVRIQRGWADPNEDASNFQKLKEGYYPGDLGFDPLGLKPVTPEGLREMQEKELNNGRLAMLAAAGFMAQEAVTGTTWGGAAVMAISPIPDSQELNNGRLAMIAAAGFMAQEAVTSTTWGPNLSCANLPAAPWCPAVMAVSSTPETPEAEVTDTAGEAQSAATKDGTTAAKVKSKRKPVATGLFAPLVLAAKDAMGVKELNKLRAEVIKKHSKVIAQFVDTSESPFGQLVVRRLFEAADRDNSGALDREEIRDALQALGLKDVTDKDVDKVMKNDLDGNEVIDFEEFVKGTPKELRSSLIKLAKQNGDELGFLA